MSVLNFKRGILRLLVAPVHTGAGIVNIRDGFFTSTTEEDKEE